MAWHDVAVVVHDLGGGEALQSKRAAVERGAPIDLRLRLLAALQRADELVQEPRHAVFQLGRRRRRHGARLHLDAAAVDQLLAVQGDEFVEH